MMLTEIHFTIVL